MKNKILIFSVFIMALFTITSCEKDDVQKDLKIDKTSLALTAKGEKGIVTVIEGNGSYKVTSSNESVATVQVADIVTVGGAKKTREAVISVTPLSAGETTVTLMDAYKEVSFKVTVQAPDVTVKSDKAQVKVGENVEVEITDGSGKYEVVVEKQEVATAEVKDAKVIVTGVKAGVSKVTVKDTETTKEVAVTVTVIPQDLEVDKEEVTITNGAKVELAIMGGTAPYTVMSSDDEKATVTVEGSKVQITAKSEEGTPVITIKDSDNKEVTVKVTLAPAPELTFDKKGTDYSGNPTEDGKVEFILGQTGAVTEITILTGTPPYTLEPKYSWSPPKSTYTIDGNKITFASTVDCSDSYKVTDANGKERALDVKIYKAISVKPTSYEILVGQEITGKIKVEGKADAFEIKAGYDTNVVTPSLEGTSSINRDLKLVGGNAGNTTITITDGVTDVTVEVSVIEPKPLQIFKDGAEIGTTPYAEDDANFVIKGGTGEYEVTYTMNGAETKLLENSTISEVYNNPGSYGLKISRNKAVREGGEVTVTVTRKDDTSDSKTFKVTCATLPSFEISIDGVAVPQKEEAEYPYANPHYTINSGYYGGRYNVYVPVDKTIDFKVLNDTAASYTIKATSYGSEKGEVIETADNKTFKVKTKEAGTYYVDVKDGDKKVLEMVVRIQ